MSDTRAQEVELRSRVCGSNDPSTEAILKLLNMQLDRIKNALLRCAPGDLDKLQGEAAAYMRVGKWIIEPLNNTSIDK